MGVCNLFTFCVGRLMKNAALQYAWKEKSKQYKITLDNFKVLVNKLSANASVYVSVTRWCV